MPKFYRKLPYTRLFVLVLLGLTLVIFAFSRTVGANNHLVIKTEDRKQTRSRIGYFQGNVPADDFYNYYEARPNTGFESPQSCLVIPYRAPSGRTSLIIVMGDPSSSYGGKGKLRISGLSPGAKLLLRDDPASVDSTDEYSFQPPTANFKWGWRPGRADGAIIRDLAETPELKLGFALLENVEEVRILTGSPETQRVMSLNPSAKIILKSVEKDLTPPQPKFSIQGIPRVNSPLTFDAKDSTAPEGQIDQYEWDFNGDGHFSYVSQKPVATHSFLNPGTHEVTLRVTDNRGRKSVTSKKITAVESPLKAERELSAGKVPPGETVNCVIKITARTELSGIGIDESIPDGWTVIPDSNSKAVYKRAKNQWVLPVKFEPGETEQIVFRMRAPTRSQLSSGDLDREVELTGEISSASPEVKVRIGGDSNLTVSRDIEPLVALAHYDVDKEKLDFSLSGRISDLQLEKAINAWQNEVELPGFKEGVTFQLIKKALLYHQKGAKTSQELSRVGRGDPKVSRIISTKLPDDILFMAPESPLATESKMAVEFKVKLVVRPGNRTLMGVGLEDELPPNWEVDPLSTKDLAYKNSRNRWIITRPLLPGEEFTIPYRVRVPLDQAPGRYKLSGVLTEAWSESTYRVRGDSSLELKRSLPIKLVISRWSIEKGELDLSMGNYISAPQAEKAIELWVKNEPVPYTEGEKLTFDKVKEIIARQLEGKSIEKTY
ncbi:MAG: PKD domain-containing protein [Candidatus Bipolaricaulia bacterium]